MDAKMTSKGQITVPKEIRDHLNVGPGDVLVFRPQADGTVVMEAATTDLMSLAGSITPRVRGVTIEDMKKAPRDGAVARFERARKS